MTGRNSRTAIEPSFCLKAALHARTEMFRPLQGNSTLPKVVTSSSSARPIVNIFTYFPLPFSFLSFQVDNSYVRRIIKFVSRSCSRARSIFLGWISLRRRRFYFVLNSFRAFEIFYSHMEYLFIIVILNSSSNYRLQIYLLHLRYLSSSLKQRF